MDIVERREHAGAWWARDAGGDWHRWSTSSNGWEGPIQPPWPLGTAGGGTPPPPPTNRIDAWWDRRFPPYSRQRLVFGLVALGMIAALVELSWAAAGRGASLPRYVFVCVAGGALLAAAWHPQMRAIAERLRSSGAFDETSRWPWRRHPTAPPAPPLPPLRTTFGRDFLVALPFSAAIVLVIGATVTGADAVSPHGLVAVTLGSVFSAGLVALRTSIWSLVIFCVAGGLLGGITTVLLSLMSWSDPSAADFYVGWAAGAVLLFVFAFPLWRGLRDLEARGFRLPMWIVMGGSVLLVSGAALVFLAER